MFSFLKTTKGHTIKRWADQYSKMAPSDKSALAGHRMLVLFAAAPIPGKAVEKSLNLQLHKSADKAIVESALYLLFQLDFWMFSHQCPQRMREKNIRMAFDAFASIFKGLISGQQLQTLISNRCSIYGATSNGNVNQVGACLDLLRRIILDTANRGFCHYRDVSEVLLHHDFIEESFLKMRLETYYDDVNPSLERHFSILAKRMESIEQ